ncbi:MAG: hypothetical protein NC113_02940 [Bacteroides sp.]|nr:hypothetical protein [Lachnospiraceae bacterium]MCM1372618.1 hypothetical protein [Bacteroides sp.]MCM1447167.1 hypothetical protein [Bacteroides sp.]
MKSKKILYFYIISIFLLANGAFSNFVFAKLHLSIWRQLIFIVGLYFMTKELKYINYQPLSRYVSKVKLFFFIVIIFSFLTIFIDHFNLVRIAYTWWAYFSGLPFIIFPFVASNSGWSERKINWFFIFLGLFQTGGLLLDFMSGGIFTSTFKVIGEDPNGLVEMGRYCFLAEAPTTFGVYYALCMMMCMKEFLSTSSATIRYVLLLIAISFIIGAWFTGSRQIVFVLALVFIASIVYSFFTSKGSSSILLLALTVSMAAPTIMNQLYSNSAYEERFSDESIAEDVRYQWWREGMEYCLLDFDVKRIAIGEGIGYVHAQKALPTERVGRHFENSIWTRMSESGILGIILFVLPVIFVLRNFSWKSFVDITTLATFTGYLFVSYISPNGEHQTSQMSVYIILGLFLYDRYTKKRFLRA